jgi:hypothetical protein
MEDIVNRVAESGIITIDLEKFYPSQDIVVFDLKDLLFMEMLLKEKEFREKLETIDWSTYNGKSLQCIVQRMQLFRCGHSCCLAAN